MPYSEGTDGFLSSRSRFRCLFVEALLRFARFGVHVGARPPLTEGRTCAGDRGHRLGPLKRNLVRSFPMRTLPKHRFWKGSHSKSSNEIASEGVTEAFSFDVLQRSPCQNSGFGAVGISKHRTKLLFWWSQKRFRCFEKRPLPKPMFWRGRRSKTSNGIVLLEFAGAFSLEVLKRKIQ